MRIVAGKYTLAITMIICGTLMLINSLYGIAFGDLWIYSPVILIMFGLEIVILNLVYMHCEDCRVEVSVGNVIFIIFVIAVFMMYTNKIETRDPFFNNFFSM